MPLPAEIVSGLSRRLAERAGLDLPAWVVESRARARIAALGLEADAYLELVNAPRGDAELAELIEAVRVGETRFFRQRRQVEALVQVVAPALSEKVRGTLKVWSAGCASGEEPYTLAIVLARALPQHQVAITATDVSDDALEVAERGEYPASAMQHVPEPWRDAFVLAGGTMRVRPELARKVTFRRQNLVEADPPRGCALVWCRNVLIYFAPDARRRAVDHLVGALSPGGYLFVGYSETLRDVAGLEPVRAGETVVYERKDGAPPPTRRTPPAGVPRTSIVTPPTGIPRQPVAAAPPPETCLRITGDCDPDRFAADLGAALRAHVARLVIDFDDAGFVPDEVATTLRRARAAARAAGTVLELRATRPGPQRWLRRHNLEEP